jgi:hypothetical protein
MGMLTSLAMTVVGAGITLLRVPEPFSVSFSAGLLVGPLVAFAGAYRGAEVQKATMEGCEALFLVGISPVVWPLSAIQLASIGASELGKWHRGTGATDNLDKAAKSE